MKVLFAVLFLVGSILGQANIDYKLKPIPKNDRTDLNVSVQFDAEKATKIKFPPGCYGTPNLYKYVVQFEGKDGTNVKATEKKTERIVTPNKNGKASLKYTLSFDPKIIENSAFAPKIDSEFFSIAGCQWLLWIGKYEKKHDTSIEIVDAPKDWKFHSSIQQNAKKINLKASYGDLISKRIGGGGDSRTFFIKNKPVSIFIKGKFDIPNEKIFDAAEKIVRVQRDWFGDYEQDFYNVVINERKGVVAGTAIENQFVCFVQPDVDKNRLNMILAHEMFHNWLPIKMRIKREKEDHQVRHEWFFEGFTEYFAKKVLFDSGLLSKEEFADLINKDIHSLADNPYKNITYKELLSLAKARKFTSTHKKLSYYRGVLIALQWEAQLRKSNKNLSNFTRSLYRFIQEKNGAISEKTFFDFAKSYGVEAREDFEKYILNGESIEVDSNGLGKDFITMEREVPLFETGFSLRESRRQKKIVGVVENGVAYKAGLRNGMEYVRARNSGRFSNSWSSEKPLTVVVKVDGKEKTIDYFPHGEMIKLLQFQVKK